MSRKKTQDPSDVSDGLDVLDNMSGRMHTSNHTELHTCSCGAMVAVPKGHVVLEDDDKEVTCYDCDKPLGQKLYEALV